MLKLTLIIRDNPNGEGLAIAMEHESDNPSEQELNYGFFINDGIQALLAVAVPGGKLYSNSILSEDNEIIPNTKGEQ
jgi:hypothetical protein